MKDFIQTLDEEIVRKLCVQSLQCGVGSMDYVYGLLIMEDDDTDQETHTEDSTVIGSGACMGQTIIAEAPLPKTPSQAPHLPHLHPGANAVNVP